MTRGGRAALASATLVRACAGASTSPRPTLVDAGGAGPSDVA
eukprot:CAMPEP_0185505780 /NCGR_PEP_ID=MMETSP1366-20130426/37868_1 /TAXON_ID=38817 /ORGANISM="Gephyrocapsa oceanica, Strain RCC1303" /LENGTH=41 /DNA_ID= /DNA_START= /DNA_END= /DNA_ORIENTATION=